MPLDPSVEYSEVEVNETNIDRYNMTERFSMTREELLNRAAEAAKPQDDSPEGFVLSVKIPKEEVARFNVFENFRDEHVDASRITHCGYEKRELEDGGFAYVCILHGKVSNHDVEAEPTAPCIQVDPNVKPTKEQVEAKMQEVMGCRYEGTLDGVRGTIYKCIIHDRESKHEVHSRSNAPCLAIDPMTPAEGDPHRA